MFKAKNAKNGTYKKHLDQGKTYSDPNRQKTKVADKSGKPKKGPFQEPSVDRWLSFGGITIITNEPRSGIEPHFARLNGELF